jgi:hypothetical protein
VAPPLKNPRHRPPRVASTMGARSASRLSAGPAHAATGNALQAFSLIGASRRACRTAVQNGTWRCRFLARARPAARRIAHTAAMFTTRRVSRMAQQPTIKDAHQLRSSLMAAEPMPRTAALHALECELARKTHVQGTRLAQGIEEFVARGMPFYSNADPHYLTWVAQAVQYWERLQIQAVPSAPKGAVAQRRTRLQLVTEPA